MRAIRSCVENNLATGKSRCQLDFAVIRAIIIVPHGKKLSVIGGPLSEIFIESAIHGAEDIRIYPVNDIVEYAKNGGEPQVSATGYDGNGVTGLSPRTDTFTLAKVSEHIAASLSKNMNKRYDVYYVDENNVIYGIQKENSLYGFPMQTIYPTVVPHPSSSAQATMTISCCFENAREAVEKFDYMELNWNILDHLEGLVSVDLVEIAANKYWVIETIGGYNRTAECGEIENLAGLFDGVTAATYENGRITLTPAQGATPSMKSPAALFAAGLKHVEYNKTIPHS